MATDLDREFFLYLFAEFELHPCNSFRENLCWSHKYSFLNMIGAKLSDQRNSRNADRFKSINQRLASRGSPPWFKSLIDRFETVCIPWIPLVPEFGTNHIEKAVFVTSASIFSETVAGMKLKFGKEILIYQDQSPFRWDFQYFCVNSSLKWRRLSCKPCLPLLS